MANPAKLKSMQTYLDLVNAKLTSAPSDKHKDSSATYYEFWQREQKRTQTKIDELRYSITK